MRISTSLDRKKVVKSGIAHAIGRDKTLYVAFEIDAQGFKEFLLTHYSGRSEITHSDFLSLILEFQGAEEKKRKRRKGGAA